MRRRLALLVPLVIAGCAQPGPPPPSLAPRAAEAIDPRLPVERPTAPMVTDSAVAARLASLLATIRAGNAAFRAAAPAVERRVAAAGTARSESWIEAQVALSGLETTLADCRQAMAEIDALAARLIVTQGGIAPGDLAAIAAAGDESAAIDRTQRQLLGQLSARLGG